MNYLEIQSCCYRFTVDPQLSLRVEQHLCSLQLCLHPREQHKQAHTRLSSYCTHILYPDASLCLPITLNVYPDSGPHPALVTGHTLATLILHM